MNYSVLIRIEYKSGGRLDRLIYKMLVTDYHSQLKVSVYNVRKCKFCKIRIFVVKVDIVRGTNALRGS